MRQANECFLAPGSALDDLLKKAGDRIGMPLSRQISPIRSGMSILDKMTLGFKPGNIYTVGGRPGMGKTSFATTITANIMRETEQQVLYISTELNELSLFLQISEAFCGGIPTSPKNEVLCDYRKSKLVEAQEYLGRCVRNRRLSIAHNRRVSAEFLVDSIRHHCEVLHPNEVALVIVDQMNRVKRKHKAGFGNYALASEDLMNSLEVISGDEGVPMMLLSQLNRGSEMKQRPTLGDFKHTGALEEYSHCCLLLHREDTTTPEAEIIVAKNRDGALAAIPSRFIGEGHTWKEA